MGGIMERRDFLTTSAMAAMAGATSLAAQGEGAAGPREYYEWTHYELRRGPGAGLLNQYLRDAYFPALKRQGLGPLGAFTPVVGPGSPGLFTLVTLPSLDALGSLRTKLAADAEYLKAAEPFLAASPAEAPYVRKASALLHAFSNHPRLAVPAAAAGNKPRLVEFRVYESPGDRGGDKKIEMFNIGEIDVFRKAGISPVFFGQAIVGAAMPNLHYMVWFPDLAARERAWGAFRDSPEWKALSGKPEYADDLNLSKTTAWLLRPTDYSEI
jgi:hypothetical protein